MNKIKLHNRKVRTDNTSGSNGIWWRKDRKRWAVQVKAKGKHVWLGQFINKVDADLRREDAEYYFNFGV